MREFRVQFKAVHLALFCGALLISQVSADVRMPAIFGDHMVLQQDAKLPVWGWADPGEGITVTFAGKSATAQAGADGKWRVDLDPVPVCSDSGELTVSGKNALKFEDVLVGDVWLAAGQSNMEIPVGVCHNKDVVMPQATDPKLRFFLENQIAIVNPEDGTRPAFKNGRGKWLVCSPETVGGCSGVAYFFARDLRADLKKPIGLIVSTFYSSAAEAWTSPDAIQKNVDKDPLFQKWLDARKAAADAFPPKLADYNAKLAAFPDDLKKWHEVDEPAFKASLREWSTADAAAKAANQPEPPKPTLRLRPEQPFYPDAGGIVVVGNLFNGMIAPIIPYALKGVVWYQGEANSGSPKQYSYLLPIMIADWRERWGEGDMPFLLVQLASFGGIAQTPDVDHHDRWQFMRETQFQLASSVKNSGIATALDVGSPNNIHPRDKMDVGERVALVARDKVYAEKVTSSGPTYSAMKIEGSRIRITFTNLGGGLIIAAPPWTQADQVPPTTDALHSFVIAGADKKWFWAKAVIDGDSVVVSCDDVPNPVAVRYAWSNSPPGLNFYNKEMLPAFPFRTDNWNPDNLQ